MEISSILALFAIIALVIGVVLMLTVVVQTEEEISGEDEHNIVRSNLFLLLALTLAVFVLVAQRQEVSASLKSALSY